MKKQKDLYKDWERISKKIERDDEELLRLLNEENEEDEEDDDEFDNCIAIPYTPPVPKIEPKPEEPKKNGSVIIGIICVIFFIAFGYTFFKFIFKQELHLVSLAITLISFVIIEVANWKRKRKNQ